MAFLDEIKSVFHIVGQYILDLFGGERSYARRYLRELIIITLVLAGTFGGYLGYRWYVVSREQAAHQTFAQAMYEYQTAIRSNSPAELATVDALIARGYDQHKASNIAPLFLALKADIQLQRNDVTQAMETLQQLVTALPATSPLAPLYKAKRALILLDSSDEALQKNGVDELLSLARDKSNKVNDMALFYLGRYYWSKNDLDDAKRVWQELVNSYSMQEAYPSPWVQEASQALKQLAQ